MTRPADSDARVAWNAAVIINLLLLMGVSLMALLFAVPFPSALSLVRVAQVAVSGALLLLLIGERRRPRLGLALAAFGLAALPQLANIPLVGMSREAAGVSFEPFFRQTCLFVVFGILAPRQAWVSQLLIGLFAIEVGLEYWIHGIGATHYLGYEPWLAWCYGLWGSWAARSRARMFDRERALQEQLRTAREAAWMTQMALAVRDLANTPLQVIELRLTLLEERHALAPEETASIRRALGRLRELSRILAAYDPRAERAAEESFESFDAAQLLRHAGPHH